MNMQHCQPRKLNQHHTQYKKNAKSVKLLFAIYTGATDLEYLKNIRLIAPVGMRAI